MPLFHHEDRSISYRDEGQGPPVVLLHSGGLSSRQWARLVPRLVATHRVIAPDVLGIGESSLVPRDAPFHFDWDLDVIDALLTSLALDTFHLVGHSYGGLLALKLALRAPERVRSMALFEPVAFGVLRSRGDAEALHDLEGYDHDGTFFDDAVGGGEAWLKRFVDWWQGPGAWDGLPDPSRAAFLKVGRKVFQEVRSLTADATPDAAYRALTMPTLLMSGSRSPLAARRVCAILSETIPNAELLVLEGAGHMAPLTHGDVVNARIVEHIAQAR